MLRKLFINNSISSDPIPPGPYIAIRKKGDFRTAHQPLNACVAPELPSEKKLEIFLTGLALRHNVAASTQNQAFNAVLFFY
jgi:hypothetical protein